MSWNMKIGMRLRGRAEMIGLNGGGGILPSLSEAHELRSEEHAQELHGNKLEVHRT